MENLSYVGTVGGLLQYLEDKVFEYERDREPMSSDDYQDQNPHYDKI